MRRQEPEEGLRRMSELQIQAPIPTIEIPKMPYLWTCEKILTSKKYVCGSVAKWAVRQSPYDCPENLEEAIKQFADNWPLEDYERIDDETLMKTIWDTINKCQLIMNWNDSKRKRTSIDEQRTPDLDFIDLHALTRNIAQDLTMEAQVQIAQDEQYRRKDKFDKLRYKNRG